MNQQSMNVAVRAGMRIGIPLAVFALIVTALYDTGHVPGAVQAVEFVIALACFFFAGMATVRQSGRVAVGALAGAICSLFAAVVILGANVVMAVIAPAQFAHAFGYHDMSASVLIVAAVTQSLVGLVLWAIFGLLLGALGGWIGSKRRVSQPADGTSPLTR